MLWQTTEAWNKIEKYLSLARVIFAGGMNSRERKFYEGNE
jgi:hypothetical protein